MGLHASHWTVARLCWAPHHLCSTLEDDGPLSGQLGLIPAQSPSMQVSLLRMPYSQQIEVQQSNEDLSARIFSCIF